tara:strand:+ start:489 stop:821 length:333 start_codon:yes stop_codon:yes gene_type:complete
MSFRVLEKRSADKDTSCTVNCQCWLPDGTDSNRNVKCTPCKSEQECCDKSCNAAWERVARTDSNVSHHFTGFSEGNFNSFGGYSQPFGQTKEVDDWLKYSGDKLVFQRNK